MIAADPSRTGRVPASTRSVPTAAITHVTTTSSALGPKTHVANTMMGTRLPTTPQQPSTEESSDAQ